jgi:hypothetical protein
MVEIAAEAQALMHRLPRDAREQLAELLRSLVLGHPPAFPGLREDGPEDEAVEELLRSARSASAATEAIERIARALEVAGQPRPKWTREQWLVGIGVMSTLLAGPVDRWSARVEGWRLSPPEPPARPSVSPGVSEFARSVFEELRVRTRPLTRDELAALTGFRQRDVDAALHELDGAGLIEATAPGLWAVPLAR